MREVSGHTMDDLAPTAHLLEPVVKWATDEPGHAALAYRDGDAFIALSWGDVYERIRALAKGFVAAGLEPGDRVALMSATRYEWMLVDYAVMAAGGVTVPIYDTSSAEQMHWIISDSGAVLAVLETPAMLATYTSVASDLHECRRQFVIDEGDLDDLRQLGAGVTDAVLDDRIAGLTTDRLATIIYTSGTTGRPKGCRLTHGNLRVNVLQNIDALEDMLDDDEVTLLFLPLAHSLTKIILLVAVEWGIKAVFATDAAHLVAELPMAQPTMIVAVPRIFEKVWNAAQHKAHAEHKGAIFEKAADAAVTWSEQHAAGHPIAHLLTNAEHALFDRVVYGKVRAVFGGRMKFAFSGGGPLGERLTHFFNGIGVKIFEGYGLTETSPTLTVNRAAAWRPGTVGLPVEGTTIRIADDGEILAKGPQVFGGYWNNEEATADTFEGGWFQTGDIGEVDDDGFVRITGRKKELIVTAAGKNVAPAPLEDRIRAHAIISQAVVVGDNRPFVVAAVTLDEDEFAAWAAAHGHDGVHVDEMVDDPELRLAVQAAIDDANQSVSRAESIRKFVILPHDLTIEDGELTPTLKIRRTIVEKHYADVIEALYA